MLTAEVLPGNIPMLKVFERSGLSIDVHRKPEGVRVNPSSVLAGTFMSTSRRRWVPSRGNLLETWDRFFQYLRTEISMAAAALRVRRLISSAVKLLKFCEE
jgi:hypothetical protein